MALRPVTYLDSTAIVRLVVFERESPALRAWLAGRRPVVTSAVARVEVSRACLAVGDFALRRAQEVLTRIEAVRLSDELMTMAGRLRPATLGALDSLHLATLAVLAHEVPATLVTYDGAMAAAARDLGMAVAAPGAAPAD
ncbi:MAG: type II toxin-antitoxin system VapC family toxin [Kineosporiaceae bacterium]